MKRLDQALLTVDHTVAAINLAHTAAAINLAQTLAATREIAMSTTRAADQATLRIKARQARILAIRQARTLATRQARTLATQATPLQTTHRPTESTSSTTSLLRKRRQQTSLYLRKLPTLLLARWKLKSSSHRGGQEEACQRITLHPSALVSTMRTVMAVWCTVSVLCDSARR